MKKCKETSESGKYVHYLAWVVQILYFKYVQFMYVNYASIKLFKKSLNGINLAQVYLSINLLLFFFFYLFSFY